MDYRSKQGMYDDSWGSQNKDELLIFGYSCKLFRDDEKALSIDEGEHLIPWMGENNLMIDRFDVRGALYDLSEAESKSTTSEPMSEAELKEEEICEQERYLALYHDETQQQFAAEEEAKRLQVELSSDSSYYNQVGFTYNASYNESIQNEVQESQMEIVAEPVTYNPSGDEDMYIPPPEMNIPQEMEVPSTVKQNKIIIKTAKFINSQGAQMEIVIKTKQAGNPMFNFLAFDNSLNPYYKYVVTLFRHGRYRWEDESDTQNANDANSQYLHPNLSQSVRPDLTPGVVASPSRPSPHCAYSKLITKIREKQIANAVEDSASPIASPIAPSSPASIPVSTQEKKPMVSTPRLPTDPVVSLVDYPSFNQTADGSDIEDIEPVFAKKSPKATVHDYSKIKWPQREIQMVIDKMACYIVKNGSAFEEIVRSRDDPRFEFLNKTHEYHPYYKCKMELYNEVYGDIFKNSNKTQDWKKKTQSNSSKKALDHSTKNGGSRTISFSIKSREQEVPLTSHSTFPVESSTSEEDEDMSDDEKDRRKQERDQRRQARKIKEEKEKKEREDFLKRERLKKEKEEEERKKREKLNAEDDSSGNEDLYDIFKYAQEMQQRDAKPKTKPAKIEPGEPVLKQEARKKKAAAFLSKLKDTKDDKTPVMYGPEIPPDIAAGFLQSASQSPTSSSGSVERENSPPPPPPSEVSKQPIPPPPPRSPSPPGLTDVLLKSLETEKIGGSSREISVSPRRSKGVDFSNTVAPSLLTGLTEHLVKEYSERVLQSDVTENRKSRSRSHKKHSRQKSGSYSPSGKRDRKKRKRSRTSSHRRKKHRSRSRSRSRGHSKSQRSHHKKKQSKHSSHREKEKSRKKKHRRHRSPSSVSSLPSSESSSQSTPTTLPSESESDMDIQVIESDERKSSRSSSIVSLPSVTSFSKKTTSKKRTEKEGEKTSKEEGSTSGGEENSRGSLSTQALPLKSFRPLFPPLESSNSSEGTTVEVEKKSLFNPNKSEALAKIAQGLRAKVHALLEKDSNM